MLGTYDFSPERQMYSYSYLLLCLDKAIKVLETESSVALICLLPKTDPRLNEQLNDYFLFSEYFLFSQLSHVFILRIGEIATSDLMVFI